MSLSQGHDTIAWYIIKIQLDSDNLWSGYGFGYVCTVTMNSEIWPCVKVMAHPSVIDNKCVKYYPDPTWQWGDMARTWISGICALWPWPQRYDNGPRSWNILGSSTTIVWNIIQIQRGSEELWPGHRFPVYVHCLCFLIDIALTLLKQCLMCIQIFGLLFSCVNMKAASVQQEEVSAVISVDTKT